MARDFAESPMALGALAVLVLLIAAAICAPWITPQDPYDLRSIDLMDALLPPGELSMAGDPFLLGTDGQGRDMLSAMVYGLRVSIGVGVSSVLLALAWGIAVGLVAAYFGGWVDALLMRIVDLQLSMPSILVALILVALLGQGVDKVVLALVIVQWAYFARTLRAAAMVERKKEYVEAAIGLDVGRGRVMFTHMLPNALPPLIVVATVQAASAISLEATLSFLGLGVPVTEPSLGMLISNGFQYLLSGRYWIAVFPGVLLLVLIAALNVVGDQLRDVINPRNQR
ncbi:MAG: ABC transporter permease [Pseudomonadota bacterium]|nr:ABC transporter permease [Pseudomonadota bacterium]